LSVKKRFLMIIVMVLLLSLAACGLVENMPATGATEPTAVTVPAGAQSPNETIAVLADGVFSPDSAICGVPVGGMQPDQAMAALKQAAENYQLSLSVNGEAVSVAGAEISLQVDEEAFALFCQAAAAGESFDGPVLRCAYDPLYQLLSGALETTVKDASITYDEAQNLFVIEPAVSGRVYAMGDLTQQVQQAVCTLAPEYSTAVSCGEIQPALTESDSKLQSAAESANAILDIALEYTFTPENGEKQTEKVDGKTLAGFVAISDTLEVTVDEKQVQSYAAALAEKYTVVAYKGDFITHYGTTLGYTVEYYGQQVDAEGLAKDLMECLNARQSGTRQAPYLQTNGAEDMPYGGNYVEVSLSAQQIWVYRDGKCVVSSSIVSGSPAYDDCTPTGVYSIYDKDRNCYLVGEDYDVFVSYWMAFTGAYGLHDASWRSYFGGEIYVYDGSHGCVNLPADVAAKVYENVQVGTKVILYGGQTEVPEETQQIYGTQSYSVASDAAPFKLDAQLLYDAGKMTYTSSNPSVATVSADGTVTIHGIGNATITVRTEKYYFYTEATMTVNISVHSPCDEGRHAYGARQQTEAPSCKPGSEERTCSVCGYVQTQEIAPVVEHTPGEWTVVTEPGCESSGLQVAYCTVCGMQLEQEIPAIGHDFSAGGSHCGNGCGTPNPDYEPPVTEEPVPGTATGKRKRPYQGLFLRM